MSPILSAAPGPVAAPREPGPGCEAGQAGCCEAGQPEGHCCWGRHLHRANPRELPDHRQKNPKHHHPSTSAPEDLKKTQQNNKAKKTWAEYHTCCLSGWGDPADKPGGAPRWSPAARISKAVLQHNRLRESPQAPLNQVLIQERLGAYCKHCQNKRPPPQKARRGALVLSTPLWFTAQNRYPWGTVSLA